MTFHMTDEQIAECARRQAEFDRNAAVRFTDEGLQATIAAGGYGVPGGIHPRQAEPLLRFLDTPERRKRAYEEASTMQNLQGGVLSGNVWTAAQTLGRMVAEGRESEEMFAEGAARRHREAEDEMRRLTGQRVILYPPEMRRV